MSINVFTATGRIGKDAETKQAGESVVTSFPLAVDVGYGDRKTTIWPRINFWGKRGEAVAPYLLKGQQVAITGELNLREYDKDDGSKGHSLEVRANDVQLLGGKSKQEGEPATKAVGGFREDDIPF